MAGALVSIRVHVRFFCISQEARIHVLERQKGLALPHGSVVAVTTTPPTLPPPLPHMPTATSGVTAGSAGAGSAADAALPADLSRVDSLGFGRLTSVPSFMFPDFDDALAGSATRTLSQDMASMAQVQYVTSSNGGGAARRRSGGVGGNPLKRGPSQELWQSGQERDKRRSTEPTIPLFSMA